MSRVVIGILAAFMVVGCKSSAQPSATAKLAGPPPQTAPAPQVGVGAMMATLRRLEAIARAHGGNRAAGTPGGEASIDEVAERLGRAGYTVSTPAVTFPFYEERSRPRVRVEGRTLASPGDVRTLEYSAGGEAEGAVVRVARFGCAPGDFAGSTRGVIALVRRGQCTLRRKGLLAGRAGATALLVVNDGSSGGRGTFAGTLGSPGVRIPVLGTSFAAGGVLGRAGARVRLRVDACSEQRTTRNVIAETRAGRREGTLMLGGHVDSVPAGPGINDNGTGVATLVEVAARLAASTRRPGRRVRFAFWGAEELGLFGSRRYVASLSRRQRREIGAYVNLDLTGSPNPVRLVYDGAAGPPGSQRVETVLRAHFRAAGLRVGETGMRNGSDHASFARAGIPVGGLFSGAGADKTAAQARRFGGDPGELLDPCYHRACDTVANVNERSLGQLAEATARAVTVLAR